MAGGRVLNAAFMAICMIGCATLAQSQALDQHTEIDATVRPGDDFYRYANGPWLAATTLPAGASRIDTSAMLRAENARRVRQLIENAVVSPNSASARLVGDYYGSWLDTGAIEARGLTPLAADLAAIAAINDRSALAAYLGRTLRLDDGTNTQTESLWGVWVHQGFHDPDHYAAHFVQGGLGLASQDDYLDPASEHVAARNAYRAHVADILRAAGIDQADIRADRVLALETAIAGTHASRADTDDVFKTDNTWRRSDFDARAPGFDWSAYFAAAHINADATFVVWQPQSVTGGAALAANQPLDVWKDYLAFHLIAHYAPVLPHTISGDTGDRAQAAIDATQTALGDAIGQLYVATYFSPQARTAARTMVENIRTAYRTRIAALTWMTPATKARALAKLDDLRFGLGYPQQWIDYSALRLERGDAFGNLQRVQAFTTQRALALIGQPVDPDEWAVGLHPQAVGAVLNLSPSTMDFAAGLLQPPYFDPTGDAASNYGSAGAGLAHEVSHSFDGVGNMYDAQGRLGQWWSDDDTAHYRDASAPLAAQLNTCCPQPDACAHGQQILGESASDLAGLLAAHDAYLLSLHGHRDAVRNGLTGEQRFFIAFAQRWRRLQTDDALRQQIANDNHAPPECRSDLVRNVDAWYEAFNVRPGDRLYLTPEARVRLWGR